MPIINQIIISSFVWVCIVVPQLSSLLCFVNSEDNTNNQSAYWIKFNSNSFTLQDICGLYNSEFLGVLPCIMLIVQNCDMDKDHDNFSIRLQFINE